MFCNYAGCDCVVIEQISSACDDCTLRNGSTNSVYPLEELLDEARDRIEERRAIYGTEYL